jgi:hypothetical protein
MPKIKVNEWERYGRLSTLRESDYCTTPNWQQQRMFLCLCDCGNRKIVKLCNLRSGNTTSCWCYHKERAAAGKSTHWMAYTKTYPVRSSMKQRCDNPKDPAYKNYWGRWISYNPRREKFENFYEDMWDSQNNLTLERRNNEGNYCKENCYRATRNQQARNKRNNKLYKGKCITDRAKELGINQPALSKRLKRWRTRERALWLN